MSTDTIPTARRPTRTSSAIAAVVAVLAVGALLSGVRQVLVPTAIGAVGVVCLAVGLGIAGSDRQGLLAVVLASVSTVAVAVGVLVGTVGTVLLLLGAFFPVESASQISTRSVHLTARVGVAGGCMLAILGVTLGVRNVADRESMREYVWLALRTGVVPLVVGTVLVAATVLARAPGDPLDPIAALAGWLVSPGPETTHVASLLGLLAAAAAALGRAVAALPVAEFLADRGSGRTDEQRVDRALDGLRRLAAAAALGAILAFTIELAAGGDLRGVVGPGLYRVLVAVSTASAPRLVLLGCLVVSVPVVLAVALLGRLARTSVRGVTRRIGPFVGGGLVTALGVALAGPLLDALVAWVGAKLPGPLSDLFRETTASVLAFYGPATVMVGLVAVLVGVTTLVVVFLWALVVTGYLGEATAGFSLASGGLFVAAAFTGAIGARPWLAFGGLVAALLVWDVGRYGTVLGREVGRHSPTRGAELVHAGGTLAVGVAGAVAAFGLSSLLEAGVAGPSAPTVVALVGAVAGLAALVAALRHS